MQKTMKKQKITKLSLQELSNQYGYSTSTMHRYMQRAEFSQFIYFPECGRQQYRIIFSPEFKQTLEDFLLKLRGRAKWKNRIK